MQPWLDIPEIGTAVIVVADSDQAKAVTACREISDQFWKVREEYLPTLVPVAEAVHRAYQNDVGLTVISDAADATTSGATGDSTWLLAELLKYDWSRPALRDAGCSGRSWRRPNGWARAENFTAMSAASVTIGFRVPFRSSRWSNDCSMPSLFSAIRRGIRRSYGRSAVLRAGNVHVVVTKSAAARIPLRNCFRWPVSIPSRGQVLVAKSPCGFRAAYAAEAREIMVVAAPGCAPPNFWEYDYARAPAAAMAVG